MVNCLIFRAKIGPNRAISYLGLRVIWMQSVCIFAAAWLCPVTPVTSLHPVRDTL